MSLIPYSEFLEPRGQLARRHKGIVVANNDPEKQGRIKVFVKGVLEGDAKDLPWCSQNIPTTSGGSPNVMKFAVPEIGSEVRVSFLGNQYTLEYDGVWMNQSMSPRQLFGDDYPNMSGEIDAAGMLTRSNALQRSFEMFHPSGTMIRVDRRGDVEMNIMKNFTVKVDGTYTVNTNYWNNGGGGMGNVLDEIAYAMLDGPYLRGIIDLATMLPQDVPIEEFCSNITRLISFANNLFYLDPEMANLEDCMAVLGDSKNRSKIQRAFQSMNGLEGLTNMLYSFFGLFGVWNSAWLGNSEDVLNGILNSLEAPSRIKGILKGSQEDLEKALGYPPSQATTDEQKKDLENAQSEVTRKIVEKIVDGFSALGGITEIFRKCSRLREVLDQVGIDNPHIVFASLDEDLKTFVQGSIKKLFTSLMGAVDSLDIQTRIIFLDRFGISLYFSQNGASTEVLKTVIGELLGSGVNNYELGKHGHIVGRFLLLDLDSQNQTLEQIKKMAIENGWDPAVLNQLLNLSITKSRLRATGQLALDDSKGDSDTYASSLSKLVSRSIGFGIHRDKVMQFIDELRIDDPVAEYTEENEDGTFTRHVRYLSSDSVISFLDTIKELRNNPKKGDSDGMVDGEPSLSEDLDNMGEGTGGGGTVIPGHVLTYMGGGIGTLCKASDFLGMADTYLGRTLAEKLGWVPSDEDTDAEKRKKDLYDPIARLLEEVYLWFMASNIQGVSERVNQMFLSQEMNSFLLGLDLHGLLKAVVPVSLVRTFVQVLGAVTRPRASCVYGANIHQILASGMSELMKSDLETLMKQIEVEIYKNTGEEPQPPWKTPPEATSEGCYYPKTYWYGVVYGCPMPPNQPGQVAMYKKSRELGILSRRVGRAGESFKTSNLQYVKKELENGDHLVIDES